MQQTPDAPLDAAPQTPATSPAPGSVLCVILNYRTAQMTLRATAAARDALAGMDAHITLVDNNSQDRSFEQMTQHVAASNWPEVRVVQSGQNGGFGAGNNYGMQSALAELAAKDWMPDYIYILNSDAFPEAAAIRALVDHLDHNPDVGFAGSLIYGEDGARHVSTFRFPSLLGEFEGAARFGPITRALHRSKVPIDLTTDQTQAVTVDWLAGASLLLRRSMLDQIGLFDERFFLYFEETDLFRRGQRAGYGAAYVPASRVMHIGSVSTGMGRWQRTPHYWFHSRWYYYVKNHSRLNALCATALHVVGGLIHRLRQALRLRASADPKHFLRDLLCHDTRAALRPLPAPQIPTLSTTPPQPHPRSEG